jgi:hypothetical protein
MIEVCVVDDDPMMAAECGLELEEAGYAVDVLPEIPTDIRKFCEEMRDRHLSVVCDHRLSGSADTKFRGSDFARDLYEYGVPNALVTAHLDREMPFLRTVRRRVPTLLSRKAMREMDLEALFVECKRELERGPGANRKAYRTMVRVTEVDLRANAFEVVVPAWDPVQNISIELPALYHNIEVGQRFYSQVNLGAETLDDVFFDGAELIHGTKADI